MKIISFTFIQTKLTIKLFVQRPFLVMPVGGTTVQSMKKQCFSNGRELRGENDYNLLMILEVITHIHKINACESHTHIYIYIYIYTHKTQRIAQTHVHRQIYKCASSCWDLGGINLFLSDTVASVHLWCGCVNTQSPVSFVHRKTSPFTNSLFFLSNSRSLCPSLPLLKVLKTFCTFFYSHQVTTCFWQRKVDFTIYLFVCI